MTPRGILVGLPSGEEYLVAFSASKNDTPIITVLAKAAGRWREATLPPREVLMAKGLAIQTVSRWADCCGLTCAAGASESQTGRFSEEGAGECG